MAASSPCTQRSKAESLLMSVRSKAASALPTPSIVGSVPKASWKRCRYPGILDRVATTCEAVAFISSGLKSGPSACSSRLPARPSWKKPE
ncbi:hypothetical protein D3C86_1947630 [compost metagenome]